MKIIMSKTAPGSIDGIHVATYEADTEYDLTATAGERDLAAAFVGAGLAVDLDAKPAEQVAPPADPDAELPPEPVEPEPPAEPKPARAKK